MPGGFAHEKIPANFDGVTFVDQDYAADLDGSLRIQDGRLAGHPWFTIHCAIWPHSTDNFTHRPFLRFNQDSGARYEASFRAYLNVSDTPPATEAPATNHLKDQTELPLLPADAAFNLTASDMIFTARIDVMQLDAKEKYRVKVKWARGTSSPSVHPRHGRMVGHWIGTGTKGIDTVDVFLGTSGKMKAGSYLIGHGLQSSILGGGFVYKTAELPTGKNWVDGRPVYRYVFTDLSLPAAGSGTSRILPIADADVSTCRMVELWGHKASPLESKKLHDLRVKFTATQVFFDSPSGGTDWSSYTGVGVWEYCKTA